LIYPLIGHSKPRISEEKIKNWFLNDLIGGKSKQKYFTGDKSKKIFYRV